MSDHRCNNDQPTESASQFLRVDCENQSPDQELSQEEAIARLAELRTRIQELEKQLSERMDRSTPIAVHDERRFAQSNALLKTVIEQSPIPIAIASPSGELWHNTAFEEYLHIEPGTGSDSTSLFEMDPKFRCFDMHDQPIAMDELPLARALRGETIQGLEFKMVMDDGCESWKIAYAAPIYDDAGELVAGFVSCLDITKLKEAEKSLRQSERESRAWLDYSPICTKKIDLDFNLQFMSNAGVKALRFDDITQYFGKPYPFDFFPESFKESMISALIEVRDTGSIVTLESPVQDIKGNEICFHTTLVPVFDDDNDLEYILAVSIDVTERKQAEEHLRELNDQLIAQTEIAQEMASQAQIANIAKSQFLANMSHEIRTPMTAILGFAEMMAENVKKPENIEAVKTMRRNGEYLLNIINNILDVSKIEAGKMEVELTEQSPGEIVAEVAAMIEPRARAKGLDLNIDFVGPIPETIHTDPTRLRQILVNLVGNAVKFTEHGEVKIITSYICDGKHSFMQFDVLDTGIGVTSDQLPGLFMPFTQGDGSTTRRFGGTGLGLAISKSFAELLGGDITIVESTAGVGSRFRARISTGPFGGVGIVHAPSSAAFKSHSFSSTSPIADLSGRRILLAEDGEDNQHLISYLLTKAGAEVQVVENGRLAYETAMAAHREHQPFDCLLMDIQMPIMSGHEATGKLRAAGYSAPIIALTAHAMIGDREKCIDAGCDDFANKPIDRAMLINLIDSHARRWSNAA